MYLSHVHADVLGCGSGNGLRELWREGNALLGMGMALWLLSLGLVYCDYAYCGFVLKHANPSSRI